MKALRESETGSVTEGGHSFNDDQPKMARKE
jgi:hypothetical protein